MRRWLRRTVKVIAAILLLPFVLAPVLLFVNPPVTVSQLWKKFEGAPIRSQWVPISQISKHLPAAVVSSEDGRFCRHHGVDWDAVQTVVEDKLENPEKRTRGASTVTMQLAKNLFFPPGRSYARKVMEVPLALWIDLIWSKRRQMEIYLNIVEWGPGVYGAEAAARHHFKTSARRLSWRQASRLAAALPNPIARRAGRPGRITRLLSRRIERRMRSIGPYISCLK